MWITWGKTVDNFIKMWITPLKIKKNHFYVDNLYIYPQVFHKQSTGYPQTNFVSFNI